MCVIDVVRDLAIDACLMDSNPGIFDLSRIIGRIALESSGARRAMALEALREIPAEQRRHAIRPGAHAARIRLARGWDLGGDHYLIGTEAIERWIGDDEARHEAVQDAHHMRVAGECWTHEDHEIVIWRAFWSAFGTYAEVMPKIIGEWPGRAALRAYLWEANDELYRTAPAYEPYVSEFPPTYGPGTPDDPLVQRIEMASEDPNLGVRMEIELLDGDRARLVIDRNCKDEEDHNWTEVEWRVEMAIHSMRPPLRSLLGD